MSLDTIYQRSPAWAQTLMLNAHAARIARYRQGPAYRAALSGLMKSQYSMVSERNAYRDQRLREIVRLAYEKSAYYRGTMDAAGVSPEDIKGAADLSRLPVITKETVRESGESMLTAKEPLPDWRHGHTSGTTGSPLSLWYDRDVSIINDAVDRRQKIWGGMAESDWIGVFLGRVVVPPRQHRPPFWRVNRVHRQVWFSSFHLSDDNLDHFVREIVRRRLQFLEGYPSTIFILAQHLVKRGQTLPMRAVFTSSETLHTIQSEAMETAFGCRPFDFYGHAERTIFATECEVHAGKHLSEEYGYTEIVNDEGTPVREGERGYLTGTSLHNKAMPMIRYRTGDLSAILTEPCQCGRTLARIESVATKAEDIVVTPDGRMVSPSILTHPFKPFPQILKSQIIQDRRNSLLVKIVPSAEFTADHQKTLTDSLAERLGPEMKIEVALVDQIPNEASGKFRWIISRVDHPSHFGWSGDDA